MPDTTARWSSWVGMRMKQLPVQWMYWWWVLNVALDICRCGSVVHATNPNLDVNLVFKIFQTAFGFTF